MAGFFLIPNDEKSLNVDEAMKAFEQKGLVNPSIYQMGDYQLYLFHKLTAREPYLMETEYGFCAVVGTYVYKGYDYELSLKHTLQDYAMGSLSLEDTYGQFTLILYVNNRVCIVSDALNAKHFFSDRQYRFFTSSFFAATRAIGNVSINDMAVYEKMLTGIVVSPDTLVNEVIQMCRAEQEEANKVGKGITFLIHSDPVILLPHDQGREASVKKQAENIKRYFEVLRPAFLEERIDLGLSAGHDSSLLFAALASDFKERIHVHTHSTGHVHDREKNAAVAMAGVKDIQTAIVPTPRLDEADIDLQSLLMENLAFFDGRTSLDIGGFSATYRAQYRLKATDGCLTTLTGVGGECFRNLYSVRGRRINSRKFFFDKVYNRSFINATNKQLVETVSEYHIKKAERILKTSLRGTVDRLSLRRYYSEVMMPDGQGNVIDAYSIVSKCIAPFLDPHILLEAYRDLNYLGNCGEYESSIICALDPKVGACINVNNGYPFNHIPLKLRIKEAIRASVSSNLWERLYLLKAGRQSSKNTSYLVNVMNRSKMLKEAFGNLEKRYPDIDFMVAIKGYAMDALTEYLSMTLRELLHE